MSTVLITGAYGFLGRYTSSLFKKNGWRVIGIGHGHWGFEDPSCFGLDRWLEADIDLYTLEKIKEKIDCVVHCAGGASVGYSVQYPLRDFERTVTASINLLEYLRHNQPGARFVYPSSAAVYGKKVKQPIGEDEGLSPVSPYGFHKKIVEELAASYATNFGTLVSIVRLFSVYGYGLKKQLLWDACNKLSRDVGRVEFFGTGEETRDWVHVRDAASLIFCLAESSVKYEVINGGGGEAVSIKHILTSLAARFEGNPQVGFNQEFREGDPKHYQADISRALRKDWRPSISLQEGLSEYVQWYKSQKNN